MAKIKDEIRCKVWNKYNNKCAYCGCELPYDKMQVDHIKPLYRKSTQKELDKYGVIKGKNIVENYNPSCSSCNASKNTFTLEKWRKEIALKKHRLNRDSSTFRILRRFGLVEVTNEPVVFYFEKHK